jgi:2-polyprenyl-6-methoxyphenol hydroxylase-like FAD-dependent oxidoreductase
MPTESLITTDVLIAGAGPAGLAMAIELGSRGIRTLLVEQNESVGNNPRAKTTNVRSMEHMRRWGIADKVKAQAPLPLDYPRNAVFATRLFGYPLGAIENALFMSPAGDERFSEPSQWIPQYKLEQVLRAHVSTLAPVTLLFKTRLEAAANAGDHVDVTLASVDGGASHTVRAKYLVGADGARSRIRSLIGAKLEGDHGLTTFMGAILRIPGLVGGHPQTKGFMYLLANASGPCMIGPMDEGDLWFWAAPVPPGSVQDEAETHRRVAAALGAERPFDILRMDPWQAHRLIADHYSKGRMYLIGDACHLHPPFGGYGMNMGIGDAVDLGWKMAAALQGWGGQTLLGSYEIERRPVHQRVINEAVENMSFFASYFEAGHLEQDTPEGVAARAGMSADMIATKQREFRGLGVMLGYDYAGSPVIIGDGTVPPPPHPLDYVPSATPGCRAPHVWLGPGRSLFDTFGPGFTLLVTEGDPTHPEVREFRVAAEASGIPLAVSLPRQSGLSELYGARFALIRPDHHVAWRGNELSLPAQVILDAVRGR